MSRPNIVLVTIDEVRPDHLSCYEPSAVQTPSLERIAEDGVLFEEVISSSCLTPISHASILTGLNPPNHGVRSPFGKLQRRTIAERLQAEGYETAAFVGVNLLGRATGFSRGFAFFDEPTTRTSWRETSYGDERPVLWGNECSRSLFSWLEHNRGAPFFLWTHYFECHEGAEKHLLREGVLAEGHLAAFCYYDAKIRLMDSVLIDRLLCALRALGLERRTHLVITSDHGTNLGEHALPFNETLGIRYPQHVTLHDCDLRVPLILKGPGLPSGKRIPGMARSIDIAPTILEMCGMDADGLDGVSLLPSIERGEQTRHLTAYAEELFRSRGPGDYQCVRDAAYKLIIDRRSNTELLYDLLESPNEEAPLDSLSAGEQRLAANWRRYCDSALELPAEDLSGDDRQRIVSRLRHLGYI